MRQPQPEEHRRPRDRGSPGPAAGTRLVIGLLLLAVGLGAFAVWYQWRQTRRSLAFLGPAATRRIQSAHRVEIWTLAADGDHVRAVLRRDVSRAAGLVHLRRGLVEDVNFRWDAAAGPGGFPGKLPAAAWDAALAFDDGSDGSPTILAFDLDGQGFMALVGRPGRVTLGPIGPGLRRWIEATNAGFPEEKSGF